jgi:uncharacterized Zn finger protein
MQQFKCQCRVPDPQDWTVIRISGRDKIIRCSACGHIWHTVAKYSDDLPEKTVSEYEWRRLIHTPEYHKGEEPLPCDPGEYLDPDFKSRFLERDV